MNTHTRRAAHTATAISILVVLGIAAHLSPEFKQHATTAGTVLLALISLSGMAAGLVLRHLDTQADTTSTTRGAERPPDALAATAGAPHIRGDR